MNRRFFSRSAVSAPETLVPAAFAPDAFAPAAHDVPVLFASSRALRVVARGVLAMWLMPMVMTLMASLFLLSPETASAQETANPPAVTLVILDFDVAKGLDPVLGRKAADAVAVELKNSGNYLIVSRADVEKAVTNTPGLTAPFTPETQVRLARTVNANAIVSGRVVAATTTNRAARIQIETRQLDAMSGDIVNGANVLEATGNKLTDVDSDILLDEAINKASFSIVRQMNLTRLPQGTILNVTATEVLINLGKLNGLVPGQKYSVMRDVLNTSINVVERIKVAEVTIRMVEADQATATVSAGGVLGVRTGDKIRQIFMMRASAPVTPSGGTGGSIALPPVPGQSKGGIASKGFKLGGGLLALGALIVLGGAFGGSKSARASTAPNGIRAVPTFTSSTVPAVNVNYSSNLPGLLGGENIIGYFIYRGTDPNFSTDNASPIEFLEGDQRVFNDVTLNTDNLFTKRTVTITEVATPNALPTVTANNTELVAAPTGTSLTQTATTLTVVFFNIPATPGVQYFYKVARVTASKAPVEIGGGGGGATGDQLNAVLSTVSASSGGATPLVRPTINSTNGNLDDLRIVASVASPTDLNFFDGGIGGADQLIVQVLPNGSTENAFSRVFSLPGRLSPQNTSPGVSILRPDGSFNINLGDIALQNFTPGDRVDIRVGVRNSTDRPGANPDPITRLRFVFSPTFIVNQTTGRTVVGSRAVAAGGSGRRSGGVGLPGSSSGTGRFGGRRTPGSILRPH